MLRLVVEEHPPGPPAHPDPGECLMCFVERMVAAYGCGNRMHFAGLWRDRTAPRATALEGRLGEKGGYCDCEVLWNAYWRRSDWDRYVRSEGREDARADQSPPPCQTVRRGSTKPCGWWMRRPRYGGPAF